MKRGKGGVLNSLLDFIWLLIFTAIIYAFIKVNNITDASSFFEMAKLKSYEVRACLGQATKFDESVPCNLSLKVKINNSDINRNSNKKTKNSNKDSDSPVSDILNPRRKKQEQEAKLSGINTNKSLDLSKEEAQELLNELRIQEPDTSVNYNRADWKHWAPTQSNCWNAREEILYNQSDKGSIIVLDKNKKETGNKKLACYIVNGKWYDPYDNITMNRPSEVDVDHTYPLGRAALMGGDKFTKDKKREFANDLDNLVATSRKSNRGKGSKGPGEWMPPNKDSWCAYSKIYINISSKYDLGITNEDKKALLKAVQTCSN